MLKEEYFKKAIKAKAYRKKRWITSVFSVVIKHNEVFPYMIERKDKLVYFIDENNQSIEITDAVPDEPLFRPTETLMLSPEECPNLDTTIKTSYGNALANLCVLVECYGNKIPYVNDYFDIGKIEAYIIKNQLDTVPDELKDPKQLYVDEYLKFGEATDYIEGLSSLFTISATIKTLLPPPGIKELRDRLVKEAGDKINDPVEFKKIEQQLMDYTDQYLKDDPSYKKFLSGKALNNSYRSRFLTYGLSASFDPNEPPKPIVQPLNDGLPLDPEILTTLINGIYVGSYSRAKETVKGGVLGKWLTRWASAFSISPEPCNTTNGIIFIPEAYHIRYLVGSYVWDKEGWLLVKDEAIAKTYLNKTTKIRSPGFCESPGFQFCPHCLGLTLAANPRGLTGAAMQPSAAILTAALKAMHQVGVIKISKLNPITAFS